MARNRTFTFQPTRELNEAYDEGFDLDVAGFHTNRPVFEDKTHAFVDILLSTRVRLSRLSLTWRACTTSI